MRTEGYESGTAIYDNFDEVDIALMTDQNYEEALSKINKDIDDEEIYSPLTQLTETMQEVIDKQSSNYVSDIISSDFDGSCPDMISDEADEYIDVYYDMSHGETMDIGEMIDFIANTN